MHHLAASSLFLFTAAAPLAAELRENIEFARPVTDRFDGLNIFDADRVADRVGTNENTLL